jgi:hypothetical protein
MAKSTVTSARQVHALLAAVLDDPNLVRDTRYGLLGSTNSIEIDLGRLRLFAGLTVKVRQNDLSLSLPLTFAVIDRLKISIELFAEYAAEAAALRKANKKTSKDKIESLANFLSKWLDKEDPDQALIWDAIRHDLALIEIREASSAFKPNRPVTNKVTARSVPLQDKQIIRHSMSCSLIDLDQVLRLRAGHLSSLTRRSFHHVYYWDTSRRCVGVNQINELADTLIDCSNGCRTVAQIGVLLKAAGVDISPKSLREAFQELYEDGLLKLRK